MTTKSGRPPPENPDRPGTDANGWTAQTTDTGPHVVPLHDLRAHDLDPQCWCGPALDENVWVHHSMDRREEYEEGRKPS
jgi:hypothetical protein